MTIQKRALIMLALLAFALTLYCVGRYSSPYLIYHVVEQSLIQKAPPFIDSTTARVRLESLIGTEPDKKVRMQRLLKISEYLEKTQRITPEEWNSLDEWFPAHTSPDIS